MATANQILTLRLMTDTESTDPPFDDAYMGGLIDEEGSVNLAAVTVWRIKAAQTAGFVDVTESGSSRKLSQLTDQALKMANAAAGGEVVDVVVTSPFTIGSERV
jgi:hypothetical protein